MKPLVAFAIFAIAWALIELPRAARADLMCDPSQRVDCGSGLTRDTCEAKGCCWMPASYSAQSCFARSEVGRYALDSWAPVSDTRFTASLTVISSSSRSSGSGSGSGRGRGKPDAGRRRRRRAAHRSHARDTASSMISPLSVTLDMETATRAHLKIVDPSHARWEIPDSVLPAPASPQWDTQTAEYSVAVTRDPATIQIVRTNDSEIVFSISQLMFESHFVSFRLATARSPVLYGLGEHVNPLRLNSSRHSVTMWDVDVATPVDQNAYGSHPFLLELRHGLAHGVFFRNSNGMDVEVSDGFVTFFVQGGVVDLYVFVGPTPLDVIEQYHTVIGTPYMPAYWTLGWHQCKFGYPSIDYVKQVVANYSSAALPLDTIWADIDHMDAHQDFTFDPTHYPVAQMTAFAQDLHKNGMHYVAIVDPGIHVSPGYAPYDRLVAADAMIHSANGSAFVGQVWPGNTIFPDFLNPAAHAYWTREVRTWLAQVPFDGMWIDMNEISNFRDGDGGSVELETPYSINNWNQHASLGKLTVDPDAVHHGGALERETHNLYGLTETMATREALENVTAQRAFLLSRSTFPGSGHHGAHWLGDNHQQWPDLYYSITGMLNANLFGVAMAGADVCGFQGTSEAHVEELCTRWIQVAAFYPFARSHADFGSPGNELYQWPMVAKVGRQVLATRYRLLPYVYTQYFRAHTRGGLIVRPLFVDFADDAHSFDIDRQFLVGPALLVSPALAYAQTTVSAYLPPAALWYDYWTGEAVAASGFVSLDAPLETIPVHLRGGHIVVRQGAALTTAAARALPFDVLVALDRAGGAAGELYVDDGTELAVGAHALRLQLAVLNDVLRSTVVQSTMLTILPLITEVTVLGVDAADEVTVNGVAVSTFTLDEATHVLTVSELALPPETPFTVAWA